MREAWQKKKLILKVALKLNKKIASLVVHIDWYLLKILLLQRYKKFLKKTNYRVKKRNRRVQPLLLFPIWFILTSIV